jgi:ankyrin repeat protein
MALLLQLGLDVDAQDNDGMTPLLLASQRSSWDVSDFAGKSDAVVQLLLEHGANVNVWNKNGERALHLASQHGRPNIMELLLKFGADVDAQDNNGMTPLHSASQGQGPSCESPISDFGTVV